MTFFGFEVVKICLKKARPNDPVPPVMRIVLPFKSKLGSLKAWIVALFKIVYSEFGAQVPKLYLLKSRCEGSRLDFDAIAKPLYGRFFLYVFVFI